MKKLMRKGLWVVAVVLSLLTGRHADAQTISCAPPNATLAFGTINILSGSPSYASTSLALSCTNTFGVAITAYACLSVGSGSGGGSSSARTLSSGASTIPAEIRQTTSSASQIGDGTTNPMEGPFTFTIAATGTTVVNFPLTGIIRSQVTLPAPGTYTSVFTGTQLQVIGTVAGVTTCPQVVANEQGNFTGTLTLSATVPNQCSVAATAMVFPATSLLNTTDNATSTVTVTCNATSSVVVALDNGATGTGPTTRKMVSGANSILYGIYKDSARSLPWGSTTGTNTQSVSLTGASSSSLTAYGQVAPQSGKPPGTYTDVVNITITY